MFESYIPLKKFEYAFFCKLDKYLVDRFRHLQSLEKGK